METNYLCLKQPYCVSSALRSKELKSRFQTNDIFSVKRQFFPTLLHLCFFITVFCCSLYYLCASNIARCDGGNIKPNHLGYIFSVQNVQQVRLSKAEFQNKYSHKVTRVLTLYFYWCQKACVLCFILEIPRVLDNITHYTGHVSECMYHSFPRSFLHLSVSRFVYFKSFSFFRQVTAQNNARL